ncbi:MAG: tRNA preQ1(34) S-adenosylmethionine ribosyltransferase-isomerase QueA [Planctomycetes bacterium]|nr:tRNA preQ1(34) S-adenosylmethionine ribosyltransferase-isomerase QueA [Planctomycetota bacterium]
MSRLRDFGYNLSDEKIAYFPASPRDSCKLLVVDRRSKKAIADTKFTLISKYLEPGSLLILNDSKVVKARLYLNKQTGGKIELLIVSAVDEFIAKCLVDKKRLGRHRELLSNKFKCEITGINNDGTVCASFDRPVNQIMSEFGVIQLPPYIKRNETRNDEIWYQNIYAEKKGSIAAPTSGLHFSERVFRSLSKKPIKIAKITLHISMDTFKPIREDDLKRHVLTGESYEISQDTVNEIMKAKADGRKVVACGTSAVRCIEHWARTKQNMGSADIYINPPFQFLIVDQMITNFHQPYSFPLLMVSAFAGRDLILSSYEYALSNSYRFLSYGDAMLIL